MNWEISKAFNFEMGHRVWAQKLEHPELSIDTSCSCRRLHGHSYTVKVCLSANELDNQGMILDFKNLNFMKVFFDEKLDHKFMLDINDPLFCQITNSNLDFTELTNFTNFTNFVDFAKAQQYMLPENDEFYSSFVLVNCVPTSENICKHIKHYAQEQIKHVATVSAVELWETAKSYCRYFN